MKWFWYMLGYESDEKKTRKVKEKRVLDFHFSRAEDYFNKKVSREAKKIIGGKVKWDELSQKQKEQQKGWSKDYASVVAPPLPDREEKE
tara:strand:- start:1264 stop:1530 length:267 start_codon:yes stop_codon:yes gene_type:complete